MYKRAILILVAFGLLLAASLTPASAEEFAVTDYSFVWHVAEVGAVKVQFHKDGARSGFVLSSRPHGRLQSLFLSPWQAKVIGEALMKAEQIREQQKGGRGRAEKTVSAGEYEIIFSSLGGGQDFQATVQRQKTVSAAVRINQKVIAQVREYLLKAEEMAAFVNNRWPY